MTLGVLLILMGLQIISTGLIGEILRNYNFKANEEYAIRKTAGIDAQFNRITIIKAAIIRSILTKIQSNVF
jgi:hypothetical protein